MYRSIFVVIFVGCSLAQIIGLLATDPAKLSIDEYSELYLMLGTLINSVILIFQLFLMRLEILRERPYSPVHRIYWIYLPIITLARLIAQIVDRQELQIALYQLSLSAVIFADALLLCLYSMLLKRQEISEYEHRELFRFDHLNVNIEQEITSQLQEFGERPANFPLLKVELQQDLPQELRLKVYNENGVLLSKAHCSVDVLAEFYTKCCKFDLNVSLNFEEEQLQHNRIEQFFEGLLNDWRNYEPFVLDFLGLTADQQQVYRDRLESMRSERTRSLNRQLDPCCLFLSISVFKVMHIRSHFEYFVSVSLPNGQLLKEFHKRYTQFEEFDRRLRTVEIREGASQLKLRVPDLPEKYYLNMQEADVEDRRFQLEQYLRRIANDGVLLKRYRESREIIVDFMCIRDVNLSLPNQEISRIELSFQSKSISKMVAKNNEPATYYSFLVQRQETAVGVICKRYSEFEELHKELRRWMHNTQVEYRSAVLPPKKLGNLTERDKQLRHRELTAYLNILSREVRQLDELYEWRAFLGPEIMLQKPMQKPKQSFVEMTEGSHHSCSSVNSSRLDALIDNLGEPLRAI